MEENPIAGFGGSIRPAERPLPPAWRLLLQPPPGAHTSFRLDEDALPATSDPVAQECMALSIPPPHNRTSIRAEIYTLHS